MPDLHHEKARQYGKAEENHDRLEKKSWLMRIVSWLSMF